MSIAPGYTLVAIRPEQAAPLLQRFHRYGCGAKSSAAYLWNPPHHGCAKAVCPSAPHGVLALSRMVATPRDERKLNHVSKPLRRQLRVLIDRSRWPVLVTFSDEGLGHTGYVYKCSGWHPTARGTTRVYLDAEGNRVSRWADGKRANLQATHSRNSPTQRWEHHATDADDVAGWMQERGWFREPIPGKVWRSGRQAHRIVHRTINKATP